MARLAGYHPGRAIFVLGMQCAQMAVSRLAGVIAVTFRQDTRHVICLFLVAGVLPGFCFF
ncbi:hypothetical protein TMES_07290 [Thalassospira mesophila]|uniref:Uncharacterized protein n=1 Tax=Thalassospira mesophila TaxID=1293891 RepID=A0A1Y2L3J6_9PROT|nr:hypothetical protein TMES_07290 [Thalassospira mesophila]